MLGVARTRVPTGFLFVKNIDLLARPDRMIIQGRINGRNSFVIACFPHEKN